jgi:hypothetical protein
MKLAIAVAGSSLLAGCVGIGGVIGPPVQAYPGAERPDHELAELVATRELTPAAYAALVSVDGRQYGDTFYGFPIVMKVLPGEHRVGVTCGQVPDIRYPALTATFQAGHVYEFKCRDAGNGMVAAAMVDLGEVYPRPAPPPKEEKE